MVGAGRPPSRKPSAWNGWPVSDGRAASRATQAAITRGTSASGAGTSWWSSHAVSMVASRNSSLATSARRNPALVVRPRIAVSSSAATSARRAASRSGPCAITLPSIGSYAVLTTWPRLERVRRPGRRGRPPHQAGACRPAAGSRRTSPRRRPAPRSRARASVTSSWANGSGSPAATAQLQLDQVDAAGDQLGDRVLDLEPGVHLQEVGLAGGVVEQELDGAGVDVADLRGPARPPRR